MKCSLALVLLFSGVTSFAQEKQSISLKLSGAVASESEALRLLPTSTDLKGGNAAVVMLKIIWEQTGWMQNVWPELAELAKLPHDDERVQNFQFDSFQRQIRRAAMMKTADWEYPLDEEPLAMILLPDVQGMRQLVGQGTTVWVNQQIAKGDLASAREGTITQFACARHIARTPIVINHLVAASIANSGLQRLELLIQQNDSPNLYWALAGLPNSIGNVREAIELESRMMVKSIPSLRNGAPSTGDPDWKLVAAEFSEFMSMIMPTELTNAEAAALQMRMMTAAREDMQSVLKFTDDDLSKMLPEEQVMRWIMLTVQRINTKIENAFTLPPSLAVKKLAELEDEIAQLQKRIAAPAIPWVSQPSNSYMALYGFGRRVKLLQTVEAIRDHMAQHDGELPATLAEIELFVPADPFTGRPFNYDVQDSIATLSMPNLDAIPKERQRQVEYTISQ